ncbi:MAG: BtpA/SgcQ family protein [Thaumarchaeota archaeon]|jgi:membrane complex biogenesis BtpA family protein|nr:BtpA/SgcQ family protein [Candidatus Geocrenenecus arthurdayi]
MGVIHLHIKLEDLIPEWAKEFYGKRLKNLDELFGVQKPIIGMVHLMPLPGSPAYNGWTIDCIVENALREAKVLVENGVDGLIVENMWDLPYYAGGEIPPEEVAAHSIAAREVVKSVNVPVGITCIHNGGRAALGIAKAAGAKFIRVCLYTGALIWDTGQIDHGNATELMRLRKLLHAWDIRFFADVYKKHAVTFPGITPEVHANWTDFYLADAIIVTGKMTGVEPELGLLKTVKEAVGETPVIIGSGANIENIEKLLSIADGAIVGTFFKVKGITQNPVDPERVRKFMEKVREVRLKKLG